MKRDNAQLDRDPMLPWLPLFIIIFLLYLPVSVRVEDDAWFATVIFGEFDWNIPAYLNFRYHTWSTRLILETLMVPLLRGSQHFAASAAVGLCGCIIKRRAKIPKAHTFYTKSIYLVSYQFQQEPFLVFEHQMDGCNVTSG